MSQVPNSETRARPAAIVLTLRQLRELMRFAGGDEDAEISIGTLIGGATELRAWCTEYPEEGSIPITGAGGAPFQVRVRAWAAECFGATLADDSRYRSHRFLEEALELAQAAGVTSAESADLVSYVFRRSIGAVPQEVGSVMITLAAFCQASGLSMELAGEAELERVMAKIAEIREKQKLVPPLAEAETPAPLGAYPPHPNCPMCHGTGEHVVPTAIPAGAATPLAMLCTCGGCGCTRLPR